MAYLIDADPMGPNYVAYQALFAHPDTKPYAQAFEFVEYKRAYVNTKDPSVQRDLYIAYQAMSEKMQDFNTADALDYLVMIDCAGRYKNAMLNGGDKSTKAGGKLPGYAGKAFAAANFLAEFFYDEYKGITKDVLDKFPKLTNSAFYEKMREKGILINPQDHLSLLLPILDKQAEELKLSEAEKKVYFQNELKKQENKHKEKLASATKENKKIIEEMKKNHDKVKEHLSDIKEHLIEEQKARAFRQNIENMRGSCDFLQRLGEHTHNKPLRDFAIAGKAITQMYDGYNLLKDTFAKMTKAGDIAGNISNLFNISNPIGMIGSALLTIFSLLQEEDEENPFEVMMEHLQFISKQLHSMHKEMRELFNKVFEIQHAGFETVLARLDRIENLMLAGFRYLPQILEKIDNIDKT